MGILTYLLTSSMLGPDVTPVLVLLPPLETLVRMYALSSLGALCKVWERHIWFGSFGSYSRVLTTREAKKVNLWNFLPSILVEFCLKQMENAQHLGNENGIKTWRRWWREPSRYLRKECFRQRNGRPRVLSWSMLDVFEKQDEKRKNSGRTQWDIWKPPFIWPCKPP